MEAIGEAGFKEAEAWAAEIVAPAPKQPRLTPGPGEPAGRSSRQRRDVGHGPVRHLTAERADRTRPLLLTLAFCLLAFGFFFLTGREVSGPPPLDPNLFLRIDGVRSVAVRAPSLFVTVHAKDWRNLSQKAQLELVGVVAEIAEKNGYSGAHFRSSAGITVAEWLAKTGPKLLPSTEGR